MLSNPGRLRQSRRGASAIVVENRFLVIGGRGDAAQDSESDPRLVENCYVSDLEIICSSQAPNLLQYSFWPVLVAVDEHFGKDVQDCCNSQ